MKIMVCVMEVAVVGAIMVGCSKRFSMEDYVQTVRQGIQEVPHVQEIKQMFTNAPIDHFITQYGFDREKPVLWNTEVFFGGKYIFTYQVYVSVNYEKNRIAKTVSRGKFRLVGVGKVHKPLSDDAGVESDIESDHAFGEEEWRKIVAAKGDFSVIGIPLNTNSPVPYFEDLVRAERAPRVKVEP